MNVFFVGSQDCVPIGTVRLGYASMDCHFWPGFLAGEIPIYDGGSTLLTYSWAFVGGMWKDVYTPTVEREAGWIGWRDLTAGDWAVKVGPSTYCADAGSRSVQPTVTFYRARVDHPGQDHTFPAGEWEVVPAGLLNSPIVTQTMRCQCTQGSWTEKVFLARHSKPALGQDFYAGDSASSQGLYFACLDSRSVAGASGPLTDHDHWARVPLQTIWPRRDGLTQTVSPDPSSPNLAVAGVGLHFEWRQMFRGCSCRWEFAHNGVVLADYTESWALDDDGKHAYDTTWENDGWVSGLPAQPDIVMHGVNYHRRPIFSGTQRGADGRWSSYGLFGGAIRVFGESLWGLADVSMISATAESLVVKYRMMVPWSEGSQDGVTWFPFGDLARIDVTMTISLSSIVTMDSVFNRLMNAIDPGDLGANQQKRYEVIGPLDPMDGGDTTTPVTPLKTTAFLPPWGVSAFYLDTIGHAVNSVIMRRGVFHSIKWPWQVRDWITPIRGDASFKCGSGDSVEIVPKIDLYEFLTMEYLRIPEP